MSRRSRFEAADDSVERGGTVSTSPILGLALYAIDQGMSRARVENLIGMPLEFARSQERLPALVGPILFVQMHDDGIGRAPGIECAQGAAFSLLGGLEQAAMSAPTGREALRAICANFAAFHDGLVAEFDESQSYSRFSFRYEGVEYDHGSCNEVVLGVLARLMRAVFGRFGQPHEVQMRYGRNGLASVYRQFFGAPMTFRSEDRSFGLVWERADMDWVQPRYDAAAFDRTVQQLSTAAALRRRRTSMSDFLELVQASYICVRARRCSVAAVAAKAGLGPRTAQRIAQRHGSSVGRLIDEARLKVLRERLAQQPRTDADELSSLVGLSDGRALRRAVKSWTGESLSSFRRNHAEPPSVYHEPPRAAW